MIRVSVIGLDPAIELRDLDRPGNLIPDREEKIGLPRLDLSAGDAVVDGEDTETPSLRQQRRAKESGDPERRREMQRCGIVDLFSRLELKGLV